MTKFEKIKNLINENSIFKNLISKVKTRQVESTKESEENDKLAQEKVLKSVFDEIVDAMDSLIDFKDEILKLGNHKHWKVTEVENKILNFIEEYPQVIRYQHKDFDNYNLGMFAVKHGLNKIIELSLEDEIASTQQSLVGKNIGMYAAEYGLEDIVLKALDNETASTQQSRLGYNIGMYAAISKLEQATLKSLDNKIAGKQQNFMGEQTIAMIATANRMKSVALKAIEDVDYLLIQDTEGQNIGFYCAKNNWDDCVMKVLENDVASTQQTQTGKNLGMECVTQRMMEDCILAALDNPIAREQIDIKGKTIGHMVSEYALWYKKPTLKAIALNKDINQPDQYGRSIVDYALYVVDDDINEAIIQRDLKDLEAKENKIDSDMDTCYFESI